MTRPSRDDEGRALREGVRPLAGGGGIGGLIVDLFAGGGGASEGIRLALGRDPDIAVNHDPEAIAMHRANHPGTRHYVCDIHDVDPIEACGGHPVDLLWASPDCTHHSKAKGGKPRDRKIRFLAWAVVRWARDVRPRVICLENVEEFRQWGPLDPEGQPIRAMRGTIFDAFVRQMRGLGYSVQYRELRACDYGAPTTRNRFFLVARCDGLPIVWPEPTHGPGRIPYRTAAECIDWSIPCPSIFERDRPLAEATCRRIAKGLVRYVLESPQPFIVGLNHTARAGYYDCFRGQGTDEPLQTITAAPGFALVAPHITKFHNGAVGQEVETPLCTITAGGRDPVHPGGCAPIGLVAAFLGVVGSGAEAPIGTVTAVDHHSLVTAHLARQFGESVGSPLDAPIGVVMPGGAGKTQLATSHLVKLKGSNIGQPVTDPLQTITGQGLHFGEVRAFLVKYYGESNGSRLSDPLDTITSRDRFGLVTVSIAGETYALADIGLRMLSPRELFRAQGFGEGYVIAPMVGGKRLTKTAQVRMAGNSVCPPVAAALVAANCGAGVVEEVA